LKLLNSNNRANFLNPIAYFRVKQQNATERTRTAIFWKNAKQSNRTATDSIKAIESRIKRVLDIPTINDDKQLLNKINVNNIKSIIDKSILTHNIKHKAKKHSIEHLNVTHDQNFKLSCLTTTHLNSSIGFSISFNIYALVYA